MALRAIIREGDTTSHGGTVLGYFSTLFVYGKYASGVGHLGYCPKCEKEFLILPGPRTFNYLGHDVAVEGMQTSCGATLIASQSKFTLSIQPGPVKYLPGPLSALIQTQDANVACHAQIRFLTADGQPVANTTYKLTLADGSTEAGKTDADGHTHRIATDYEVAITSAEFYPDWFYGCECQAERLASHGARSPSPTMKVTLTKLHTKEQGSDSPPIQHTLPQASSTRDLTPGEIAMAQILFKDAIDYSKVKIHRGGLFGQPNRSQNAMTPRGEIHFPDQYFKTDYSAEDAPTLMWFIHEMVHVWQYQLGYNLIWNGFKIGLKGGYDANANAYYYDLKGADTGKQFHQFNMEQQGQLIANYFGATELGMGKYQEELQELRRVLKDFLLQPKNPALLPYTTEFTKP